MQPIGNPAETFGSLECVPLMGSPGYFFGRNVRRLREARGYTQMALAERAGINRSTLADYERGAADNVELKTIVALAAALEVRPADLVEMPSGHIPIEPLVQAYLERWGAIDNPTEDELNFVRSRPTAYWIGWEPTADSVHYVIEGYRKRAKTRA